MMERYYLIFQTKCDYQLLLLPFFLLYIANKTQKEDQFPYQKV